jgi:hypothetical protein
MSNYESKSPACACGGCIMFIVFLLLFLGLSGVGSSCIKYGRQPIECGPEACVYAGLSQYCPFEKGLLGYETIQY